MNQAELTHLVSGIRVRLGPARQKFPNAEGYRGNLYALREMVSALVASERVELSRTKGELTRQYTERLIAEAVMHGDRHRRTMEVAQWWLKDDKSAVHKLFKVLVPRYTDYTSSYTRLLFAPYQYNENHKVAPNKVLVELKGHPFPPLHYSNSAPNRTHIHNVLLAEAKRDRRLRKDLFAPAASSSQPSPSMSDDAQAETSEEDNGSESSP